MRARQNSKTKRGLIGLVICIIPIGAAIGVLTTAAWTAMPAPGGSSTVTSASSYDSNTDTTTVTYTLTTGPNGTKDFHLVLPKGMRLPKAAATGVGSGGSHNFNGGSIHGATSTRGGRSVHWVSSASSGEVSGTVVQFTVSVSGKKSPTGKSPYWAVTDDGNEKTCRTLSQIKKKDDVTGWGPGGANGPVIPPPGVEFSAIAHDGEAPLGGGFSVELWSTDTSADYALYISEDIVPHSTVIPFGLTLTNGTGTLSSVGEAVATLNVPNDPSLSGKVVYATLVTFGAIGEQAIVSNPVVITIE